MQDQATYGFSKADATALLEKIEIKEELTARRGVTGRRGSVGSFVEEVRWVDPVLEYRIGATWYTIDTAENCGPAVSPFVPGLGI
jgi:hypothetical protein